MMAEKPEGELACKAAGQEDCTGLAGPEDCTGLAEQELTA